jgi:hypothetical protein
MTEPARHKNWDFALTVITVALLGTLGVQSFIGTLYVWWATTRCPASRSPATDSSCGG